MATNVARSLAFHSHSRFWSTPMGRSSPNTLLFTVVSIWKTFTPASRITLPMRQLAECRAECSWSMNDFECCIVWTLWW